MNLKPKQCVNRNCKRIMYVSKKLLHMCLQCDHCTSEQDKRNNEMGIIDTVCTDCGKDARDLPAGAFLKRTNQLGEIGIWRCSQECGESPEGPLEVKDEQDKRDDS